MQGRVEGGQPGQGQAQAEEGQERQREAAGGLCTEGAGGCCWVAFLFLGPKRRPREKSIQLQERPGWGLGKGEGMGRVERADRRAEVGAGLSLRHC